MQPKRLVRPGQLAGNSERARGIFFSFLFFSLFIFLNMKPLSVEMACLLGIQNKIQAVWRGFWRKENGHSLSKVTKPNMGRDGKSNSGKSITTKSLDQDRACGLTSSLVSLVIPRVQFVAYPPLCSDRSYGHHHCALAVHHNGVLMSKFVSDLDSYCF